MEDMSLQAGFWMGAWLGYKHTKYSRASIYSGNFLGHCQERMNFAPGTMNSSMVCVYIIGFLVHGFQIATQQ